NVVKNGLIMFAVGIALALAAPVLAQAVGGASILGAAAFEHAVATPVLWTGLFFGAFGAIHAALTPACEFVFRGGKPKEAAAEKPSAPEPVKCQQVAVSLAAAPQIAQENNPAKFQDALKAER